MPLAIDTNETIRIIEHSVFASERELIDVVFVGEEDGQKVFVAATDSVHAMFLVGVTAGVLLEQVENLTF